MTSLCFSTRHQRFTHVRLPSTHLTGISRLFRNAHDLDHWTDAASGGLDPDPAVRVRGAHPHRLVQQGCFESLLTSWSPLRAVVAHCHPHIARRSHLRAPASDAMLEPKGRIRNEDRR